LAADYWWVACSGSTTTLASSYWTASSGGINLGVSATAADSIMGLVLDGNNGRGLGWSGFTQDVDIKHIFIRFNSYDMNNAGAVLGGSQNVVHEIAYRNDVFYEPRLYFIEGGITASSSPNLTGDENNYTYSMFTEITQPETSMWLDFSNTTSQSSTSSLTIGTGTKTLIVATGSNYNIGQHIVLTTPSGSMTGTVTSYDTGSGQLTINVTSASGSGTYTEWNSESPAFAYYNNQETTPKVTTIYGNSNYQSRFRYKSGSFFYVGQRLGGAGSRFAKLNIKEVALFTRSLSYEEGLEFRNQMMQQWPVNTTLVYDNVSPGVILTRGVGGALFNSEVEYQWDWDNYAYPTGTEWNSEYTDTVYGWGDLTDVTTRTYATFYEALNYAVGSNAVATELVMHDTINDKYYKFDITQWGNYNVGSTYAYTRQEIDAGTGNLIGSPVTITRTSAVSK